MNHFKYEKTLILLCLLIFIAFATLATAQNYSEQINPGYSSAASISLVLLLACLSFITWRRGQYFRTLYSEKIIVEKQLNKFQMCVEQSPSSVLIADNRGIIEFINPQFCNVSGYAAKDLIGQSVETLSSDQLSPKVYAEIMQHIIDGVVWRGELSQRHRDGKHYHSAVTVRPVLNDRQQLSHIFYLHEDISDRVAYKENMFRQANYDELTNLPNRSLANDRLAQAIHNAERSGRSVMLMCIDLDRFKIVNDTLGHEQGDQLLIEAASRLKNCVREEDTIARLGGDEFLIILTSDASISNVSSILQKVIDTIDQPFHVEEMEFNVTASIGVTVFPEDGTSAAALMRNADAAMYIAKELGRNTYHFYTHEMNDKAMQRLTMEAELRHAMERDELELNYQPVIEAKTQKLVAVESLLRWNCEKLGNIPPLDFIPLAEETGLIRSHWTMGLVHQACHQAASWQQQGLKDLRIAVNISSRQFSAGTVVTDVQHALKSSGLNAESLELELTESLLLNSSSKIYHDMTKLKDMGVRLSLDDFGTGYSSLSYLKRYPFDVLKIDRSFVRDLHTDPENAALTSAVVVMAHSLGLEVIGEGVEEENQQQYLQKENCDMLQGYLFSKPLSAKLLPAWASKQQAITTQH